MVRLLDITRRTGFTWSTFVPVVFTILFACAMLIGLSACTADQAAVPGPAFAQPAEEPAVERVMERTDPQDVRFDQISLEQGLSQSTVRAVLQDRQGFMWFATADGLNRYDGYNFTIFKHDPADPASISENGIWALHQDKQGYLWIGTDGGGLERYDSSTEQFEHFRHLRGDPYSLPNDIVRSISEDPAGNIWVGTPGGAGKLNPALQTFENFTEIISTESEYFGSSYVNAIFEDNTGKVWVGTLDGLWVRDPQLQFFTPFALIRERPVPIPEGPRPASVKTIYQDSRGLLWFGSLGDGLFQLNPATDTVTRYVKQEADPHSLSSNVVNTVIEDRSGLIWVGTEQGLNSLDPETGRFQRYAASRAQPYSLSDDHITSLYVDEASILWVGTDIGGVNKHDPYKSKFRHFRANPAETITLSDPQVWSFYQDRSDYLWIGTGQGLNKFDLRTDHMTYYTHDPEDPATISDNYVTSVLGDSHGYLWVATHGGLNRYDPESASFRRYLADPNDPASMSSNLVNVVFEDSQGNIWVGTAGGGLDRFNRQGGTFRHYRHEEEDLPAETSGSNFIQCFYEEDEYTLWIGTAGGLAKFNQIDQSLTFYQQNPDAPPGSRRNVINAILKDSQGRMWLGTSDGLAYLEPEGPNFVYYREGDGLPSNTVLGILEDDHGMLWLSTNRGLSRFNPQNRRFRNYDLSDGLQSLEFNRGAYYKNEEGQMYFGGVNGFNTFHPSDITDNPYQPPVVITEFSILNEPVSFGPESPLAEPIYRTNRVELAAQEDVLSFELAALHYGSPDENRYAYLLAGFDEEWNDIGQRRFANYTNLPPGRYTLKAIGSNSDGVWNLEGTELEIIVTPPFYRTYWFVALVVMAAAASVFTAYRVRTRNIAARTRELEAQVSERTSEIEKRRQIAEGLREIMLILNSNRPLEESLHYIAEQAARLTDAEDAIIFRLDHEDKITIVATNPGGQIRYTPDAQLIRLVSDWADQTLLLKEPYVVPDLAAYRKQQDPPIPEGAATHRALLGLPLFVSDEIYGGLIMFYTHARAFSSEERELGSTFVDQAALAIANDQLREQAKQIAVASERNRIARDLHDAVTQTLFSASLIAETVPVIYESSEEEGRQLLLELRQLTRGALAEMRTLLLELRPTALEEAELTDLLHQLAEATTGRTGIPITLSITPHCKLPTNVRVALYRIAQESLNNVVKHSRASRAEISLGGCDDGHGVELVLEDDGRGFDPSLVAGDHLGLRIARERALSIGATLTIDSAPRVGTKVTVVWKEDGLDSVSED